MDRAAGGHVELTRPLATLDKRQVMQLGRSVAAPIDVFLPGSAGRSTLRSVQRVRGRRDAFRTSGMNDPTRYAAEPRKLAV